MNRILLALLLLPITAFSQTLSPPTISHASGFYTDSFYVKISHPDPDVTILYTLDGSEPRIENMTGKVWNYKKQYPTHPVTLMGDLLQDTIWTYEYLDSIIVRDRSQQDNVLAQIPTSVYNHFISYGNIFKGVVLKVAAYINDQYSIVVTRNYYVAPEGYNRYSFPVVSISVDNDKMYGYESGLNVPGILFDNWRIENPLEHFEPSTPANYLATGATSEFQIHFSYIKDGQELLNQNAGIRINGNYTRFYPNRSFRLYAKSSYGANSFNTNFFENYLYDKFKRIILRNSGNDAAKTTFRDAFIHDLTRNLKLNIQESQPIILFLNGEYNGIRNLRERYDEKYFDRVYNIDEDKLDFIENDGIVDVGSTIKFNEMMDFYKNNSLITDSKYQQALTYLDPVNFTDYYITNIFIANNDWPHNNNELWRKRVAFDSSAIYGHDGRFRWALKDTDAGYEKYKFNALEWATRLVDTSEPYSEFYNNSTLLIRRLLENENYKHYFINRFGDLLNTTFTVERSINNISKFKNKYQPEIEENSLRWYYFAAKPDEWLDYVEELNDFAINRPYYQRQHLLEKFNIDGTFDLVLDVSDTSHGYIHLNTMDILSTTDGVIDNPYIWTGVYFKNIPITLQAIPKAGYKFSHWSGVVYDTLGIISLNLEQDSYIKANFILEDSIEDSLSVNYLEQNNIKVYPNPFNEKINVLIDAYSGSFAVYSIEGRIVSHGNIDSPVIGLEDLPKGVFILELNTEGHRYRKQIIKQ